MRKDDSLFEAALLSLVVDLKSKNPSDDAKIIGAVATLRKSPAPEVDASSCVPWDIAARITDREMCFYGYPGRHPCRDSNSPCVPCTRYYMHLISFGRYHILFTMTANVVAHAIIVDIWEKYSEYKSPVRELVLIREYTYGLPKTIDLDILRIVSPYFSEALTENLDVVVNAFVKNQQHVTVDCRQNTVRDLLLSALRNIINVDQFIYAFLGKRFMDELLGKTEEEMHAKFVDCIVKGDIEYMTIVTKIVYQKHTSFRIPRIRINGFDIVDNYDNKIADISVLSMTSLLELKRLDFVDQRDFVPLKWSAR